MTAQEKAQQEYDELVKEHPAAFNSCGLKEWGFIAYMAGKTAGIQLAMDKPKVQAG